MKTTLFLTNLLIILISVSTWAAAPAIARQHQINLGDFKGMTLLQAMVAEDGIKAQLDADYVETYRGPEWKDFKKTLANFDDKNRKRVLKSFGFDEQALKEFVSSLEGKSFTPANVFQMIRPHLPSGADMYAVGQIFAMAAGAGTLVTINDDNYYYNFGYKSGANPSEDVKSGRSFGAGPLHNANDASDVFYLNELEQYIQETENLAPFYETMMEILLQCDTSGITELSDLGQTVMTDFIAIYTAELDRHLMVDLQPSRHPWEIDLAGSTIVSAFGVTVGKIMKDGTLIEGAARGWWAMSDLGNGRSGIGETRGDRKKLQRLISDYLRQTNVKWVNKIEALLPERRDGDLIQGMLEFINSYETQEAVVSHAPNLIKAYAHLISQTQSNSEELEAHILHHLQ